MVWGVLQGKLAIVIDADPAEAGEGAVEAEDELATFFSFCVLDGGGGGEATV